MIELAQPPLIVPAKPAIITAAERWESSAQRAMERAGLPRHVRRAVVAELRRLCGVRAKFIGPSVDDLSRYAGMNLAGLPGFPSVVAAAGKKSGGNDKFTVALLHFDGSDGATSFPDTNAGGSAHTWTASGNAQIDTAQSKFGGASLLLDGTGDYISTPDSADFEFGSGEFTLDGWMRFNALPSGLFSPGDAAVLFMHWTNDSRAWGFAVENNAGNYRFTSILNSSIFPSSANITIATGVWYHWAIVRDNTGTDTLRFFLDGAVAGTANIDGTTISDSTAVCTLGGSPEGHSFFNGWLDECRISKGIARWTSAFTPPTAAYS